MIILNRQGGINMLETVVIANKLHEKMKVEDGNSIDEIAVKVIRNDCPHFLLPLRQMEIDGDMELRYEVSSGTALGMQKPSMKRAELNTLLLNMLEPFETAGNWFLDAHKLCIDPMHIYVSKNYADVKYIYIPLSGYSNSDEAIANFFNKVIAKLQITDDENYPFELIRLLVMNSNTHLLYEKIKADTAAQNARTAKAGAAEAPSHEEERRPSAQTPPKENPPYRNSGEEVKAEYAQHNERKDDAVVNALFGDDAPDKNKKKGLLGLFGGKKKNERNMDEKAERQDAAPVQSPEKYTPPKYRSNSDDTDMDSAYDASGGLCLELVETYGFNCPRTIMLKFNDNRFVIGRVDKEGNRHADFCFDSAITVISKRHCCFEQDGEKLYVIDLDSKNHTYIGQTMLVPNIKYPVRRGDVIRLSDNKSISYRLV